MIDQWNFHCNTDLLQITFSPQVVNVKTQQKGLLNQTPPQARLEPKGGCSRGCGPFPQTTLPKWYMPLAQLSTPCSRGMGAATSLLPGDQGTRGGCGPLVLCSWLPHSEPGRGAAGGGEWCQRPWFSRLRLSAQGVLCSENVLRSEIRIISAHRLPAFSD